MSPGRFVLLAVVAALASLGCGGRAHRCEVYPGDCRIDLADGGCVNRPPTCCEGNDPVCPQGGVISHLRTITPTEFVCAHGDDTLDASLCR